MHRSTDGIGAPTFTDIDLSVMSVNVGVPVSSVPQCTSVSVMSVVSKLTPHIPRAVNKSATYNQTFKDLFPFLKERLTWP